VSISLTVALSRQARRPWNRRFSSRGAKIALRAAKTNGAAMRVPFSVLFGVAAALTLTAGSALAGPAVIQIPEPSSLALIAAGAGIVAWMKFRHRR
jgi:hypothetical protein